MKTIAYIFVKLSLLILPVSGIEASGAGPLPEFAFKGVALRPENLAYAPTSELVHPTVIKVEGRVESPLGRYYMYYAPHKHVAVSMAYADCIEGPWTEYKSNPVLKGPAAPDIRWIEAKGKFYMWGHTKNSKTELWTSVDGLHFEHQGICIAAKEIGTRNATYSRVYNYPLRQYGSNYIMLYSGYIEEKEQRCIWLAYSSDAESWTQLKTPLVEPVEGENNNIYGASLLEWKNRIFIVYQDQTAWRGGNIKYVETDPELSPVGTGGERFVLIDPPAGPPLNDRYRGAEFYIEEDTIHMYSSASSKPRIIVYATAAEPGSQTQNGNYKNDKNE